MVGQIVSPYFTNTEFSGCSAACRSLRSPEFDWDAILMITVRSRAYAPPRRRGWGRETRPHPLAYAHFNFLFLLTLRDSAVRDPGLPISDYRHVICPAGFLHFAAWDARLVGPERLKLLYNSIISIN